MPDSPGKRSHYLQSLIGSHGKSGFTVAQSGVVTFVAKCNYCSDPNPHGGTRVKRKFFGSRVRDVAALWMQHEASAEHDLEVSRAHGSVRSSKSMRAMAAHIAHEAMAQIASEAAAEVQEKNAS